MLKDKVFLTYKRKRLSYQTDVAHHSKENGLSPNMQMGSSWLCSPKSEPDADDEELKNHHSGKCQSSTGISRYGFTESMHQHVPASSEIIHCQMTSQNDMGPMVLRSRRVLSGPNIKKNSRLASSSTVNATKSNMKDIIKMDVPDYGLEYITCAEGSLRDRTIHDRISNTINLNMSLATEGGDSFECAEIDTKTISHSDNNGNALWNNGSSKEHSVAQLITFSRRTKMKQSASQNMTDINSKTAEKQHFSSTCSGHVARDNLSCEGSSQNCIFDEQLSRSPVVLEDYIVPSSHVDYIAAEMANVKVDDALDCMAEVGTVSKINQNLENSEFPTAVDAGEEQSKELLSLQPVYTVKDSISPLNIVPSSSGNNAFSSSVEESGNKLILDTNKCEKRAITSLSEERDSPTGLDLSVAPISICQMSPETIKKSTDLPENHRDSQSTSTPCCSFIFADDENDAKNKEIAWLESLENVLRERREDKGTCSSIVHDVIDHTERSSPIIPSRSGDQSVKVQDKAIDFVDQFAPLPPPHRLERQKAEKSTPFTDFLGCFLPPNPHSLLDLNSAASSSGSHSRDKVSLLDRAFQYSSKGSSSFFKHKNTQKAITEMMSGGRGFLSDKARWYSSEWSEDELDFLWIGVRRHGADNWNAILGDPKLQFARSRFPKDLALQWEKEQKKLFNGIVIPPAILSKPSISSTQSLDGFCAANSRAFAENPMLTADTKLSLGGVYLHNENIMKNSQFGTACLPINTCPFPPITTCPFPGNVLSMSLYPGAATRFKKVSSASRTMYQLEYGCEKPLWERSRNEQKSTGSNLPHWLKEAHGSRQSEKPWPQFFTAGNAASFDIGLSSCEPLATSKDPRGRGILKRKSMLSEKNVGMVKTEEAPASIDEFTAFVAKPSVESMQSLAPASERPTLCVGTSSQKNIMVPPDSIPVADELVVLDSEASSEETISDDQNMRSYQDPEHGD